MNGIIGFNHLEVFCIIGDLPEERNDPQVVYIDLQVEADFSRASCSDQVHDTVDYVRLARICKEVGKQGRFHLLEKYAYEVLRHLFEEFQISSAWIKIKKPGGLPEAEFAFVELKQTREKDLK